MCFLFLVFAIGKTSVREWLDNWKRWLLVFFPDHRWFLELTKFSILSQWRRTWLRFTNAANWLMFDINDKLAFQSKKTKTLYFLSELRCASVRQVPTSQVPQPTLRSDFQVSWRIWLGQLWPSWVKSYGAGGGAEKLSEEELGTVEERDFGVLGGRRT